MLQNKIDSAIDKVFEMQDAGKSEEEIMLWVEKQPNADAILTAFERMVEAFSTPKK